jgi:hypothetical protein
MVRLVVFIRAPALMNDVMRNVALQMHLRSCVIFEVPKSARE